jgi:RHS repeat-associated protein
MEMAGRGFSGSYRFGYQGSEKDNEVSGEGNSYTTEFRGLDVRLGRWFSVDPIFQPYQSPYTSMDNDPINHNDVTGEGPWDWGAIWNTTQSILDKAAYIPGPIGGISDLINIGISAGRGNWADVKERSNGILISLVVGKAAGTIIKKGVKILGPILEKHAPKLVNRVRRFHAKATKGKDFVNAKFEKLQNKLKPKKKPGGGEGLKKEEIDVKKEEPITEAKDPKEKAREQLKENDKAGKDAQEKTNAQLKDENLANETEVTLQPLDADGKPIPGKTRADNVAFDKDGKAIIVETKASDTAPFTKGQKTAADVVNNGSGKFEVRTNKLEKFGYAKGDILTVKEYRVLIQKLDDAAK